jgi:hypothetical protein
MKNIQVIDGAKNCTFSIFRATDAEFALLFPEPGQEIQFADDLLKLSRRKKIRNALDALWERPIRKRDVQGIHGTLFYKLEHHKQFYRQKREDGVLAYCVNVAQRRLFGLSEKDRALSSTTGVSSSSRVIGSPTA